MSICTHKPGMKYDHKSDNVAYESGSPEETSAFGESFAQRLTSGSIVALAGELGAGKTLLARGICRGLGYAGNVTSPSFVRLHQYPNDPPLYHADFYLVESEAGIFDLGLDELYGGDGIVIVEWAQRFPRLLPDDCWWIEISWLPGNENARKIVVGKKSLQI